MPPVRPLRGGSSLTSPLDVLRMEIIYKLKVTVFLLSAFNVFMVVLSGFGAVIWGFNAFIAISVFGFICNGAIALMVIRGKTFSDEVLLNDRID